MRYKYVGHKPNGEVVKGMMDADSEKEAEVALWKSEIIITSLKLQSQSNFSIEKLLPSLYAIKPEEIKNFNRDLETLLSAGIGIYPSLTMLCERTKKKSLKSMMQDILTSVESGSSFSEACAKHPKIFSPFYVSMAKVGEEIGNLENMLRQISKQMDKELTLKHKIKSAMMYPTMVLIVAVLAIVGMMLFLIPAMKSLFTNIGGQLPPLTRGMVAMSDFVKGNWWELLLGVIVVIGVFSWYLKTPRGKIAKDSLVLKIPLIKDVNIKGNMTRTTRNLAILLGGGISITDALDLLEQTNDNHIYRRAYAQLRTDVSDGLLLSQAIKKQNLFPSLIAQVVGVGELTGKLEPNLDRVADFYEEETDRAVERSTKMLTPIITLFIGVLVLVIALSMYQPMYAIAGQIK